MSSTVCPRSLDPFHIVSYYIKLVKTSWPYSYVSFRGLSLVKIEREMMGKIEQKKQEKKIAAAAAV